MKTVVISLFSFSILSSCIVIDTNSKGNYGSYLKGDSTESVDYAKQPMESHEYFVRNFSEIKASSGMKFFIRKSDRQKVVVNSNASGSITVSSENGVLNVNYDRNGSMKNVSTEVIVYTNQFQKLRAETAGKIIIEDDFELDNLSIDLNSAAHLAGNVFAKKLQLVAASASGADLKVQANKISVEATSASKVNLEGKTDKINIEATSASKVYIENLKYNTIDKELTTLGKIYTK